MTVQNSLVPALDRALNILEYLASRQEAVTLKEISRDLGIPSASAFRLMKNLCARGYATEQTGGQTAYLLGYKLLHLASVHQRNFSVPAVAKPFLVRLANQLQQTVQLALLQNGSVLYVDQVFSSAPISIVAPLYTPLAVNTSASAKILLSFLPPQEQLAIIRRSALTASTPRTLVEEEALLEEITKSGLQGYDFDNEEFALGIGCMAVPIPAPSLGCAAAVGITGSIQSYRDCARFREMLAALRQTAAEVASAIKNGGAPASSSGAPHS